METPLFVIELQKEPIAESTWVQGLHKGSRLVTNMQNISNGAWWRVIGDGKKYETLFISQVAAYQMGAEEVMFRVIEEFDDTLSYFVRIPE